MTTEMQELLDGQMEDALAISDKDERHDAILTCIARQSKALIDCQRKTSDRVKKLVEDISEIKTDLKPCKESDREYREAKLKAKGAKWAFGVIAGAATVVGPIVAIKLCKLAGILW